MSDPDPSEFERARRFVVFFGSLVCMVVMGVFFAAFGAFTLNTLWGILAAMVVVTAAYYSGVT